MHEPMLVLELKAHLSSYSHNKQFLMDLSMPVMNRDKAREEQEKKWAKLKLMEVREQSKTIRSQLHDQERRPNRKHRQMQPRKSRD